MEDKKMKCLQLEQIGSPLVLKQINIPKPKQNEVLIKVQATPINPQDILMISGTTQQDSLKDLPFIPGFEASGIVVMSGGGDFADSLVNQRVAFYGGSGTFAQYSVVSAYQCLTIENDVSFNQAASSFVNPLTVIGMLEVVKEAKIKAVVHSAAASAVGRMMVRYFKQNGVEVINIVRRSEQVEILKNEGATIILNQTSEDFLDQLKKITSELNATIFFDAIAGSFTGKVLSGMPNNSTAYVYGQLSGQDSSVSPNQLIFKNQSVKGFLLPAWFSSIEQELQLSFLQKLKKLIKSDLRTEIASEQSLEQGKKAIEQYLNNMSSGKILLKPQQ
ncbi:hypothetical protein ABPG74_013080 [Tetrahymena malaccensis]